MVGPPPGESAWGSSRAYQRRLLRAACSLAVALALWLSFGPTSASANSEAERLLRAGDLSAAWQAAQQEAEASPDDLDAQERRIDIALALGLQDLLLSKLQEATKARPDRAAGHYLLGRIALEAPAAEAHYNEALKRDPNFARAHMGLGAIRRADGKPDEAATLYRRALAREPELSEAWAGLQASLLQLGDLQGALEVARQAMKEVPTEPDPYIAAATLDPTTAQATLTLGVQRVPDDPRMRAMLARTYLDRGDGSAAREHLLKALKLAPNYAEAGYLLLVARELREDRLDADGWRALQAAQKKESPEEGLTAFADLVERYPNASLAWLGLGKLKAESGELDEGASDLARAASLGQGEPEILATQGLVLLRAGRADEAFPPLHAATKQRPSDISLNLAAVEAAMAAGRGRDARELAVLGLKRHPQDLRTIFQAAKVLSAQGDREGAYMVLKESLEQQPDPRLIVALAAAARDAGYYAEAALILERLAKALNLPQAQQLADQLKREAKIRTGQSPKPPPTNDSP